MKEVYIVEITNSSNYVYEKYNGTDEAEARRIYDEFVSRNRMEKVELYKKTTLSVTDNS